MSQIAICVPTYSRQSALENLCKQILLPIHNRYGRSVDIFVRDNSIGLVDYDFSFVSNLFWFADYGLNASNLSYHGNVQILFNLCTEYSYVWILPDDDSYNLEVMFSIIDHISSNLFNADVILPPFSYTRRPNFISTNDFLKLFPPNLSTNNPLTSYVTTFDELLIHGVYPFIPLTSSFIFKKRLSLEAIQIIQEYSTNAWLHEVLMLSSVDRYSSIQILYCKPYVHYEEIYDTKNKPQKSGMSIEYFHENNLELKKLRSLVFNDKNLFDTCTCWRESVLWLIQDKDKSIAWSNNRMYSFRLACRALLYSVCVFDFWLFTLCACYIFIPSRLIRFIRRLRGSHRAL